MHDNLGKRIQDGNRLTDDEKNMLMEILCVRCQSNTITLVRRALERVPNIPSYGIYNRMMLDPVKYCAGQSYPDEIRTVRNCLRHSG